MIPRLRKCPSLMMEIFSTFWNTKLKTPSPESVQSAINSHFFTKFHPYWWYQGNIGCGSLGYCWFVAHNRSLISDYSSFILKSWSKNILGTTGVWQPCCIWRMRRGIPPMDRFVNLYTHNRTMSIILSTSVLQASKLPGDNLWWTRLFGAGQVGFYCWRGVNFSQ